MIRGLLCVLCLAALVVSNADAQGFDPESGDTGDGWEPPPDNPPDNPPDGQQNDGQQNDGQQNDGQQDAGWQQPPDNGGQNSGQTNGGQDGGQNGQQGWFNGDQERPPGLGGEQGGSGVQDQTPQGETDHDQVSMGISFFGINTLQISPPGLSPDRDSLSLRLATVGIRYWFGGVGIDVGIGLGTTTQKDTNTCLDIDNPGVLDCDGPSTRTGGIDGAFGFGLHLGIPIAIKSSRHATLLFIPELGFSYGTATLFINPSDPAFDIDLAGLQIDAGLRIGGEVQFGAIGLPNLGLQITVGLGIRFNKTTAENGTAATDPSAIGLEGTDFRLRTIANDLLNGLVRLNYYF